MLQFPPAVFQRETDNSLRDVLGVKCFLDNILIEGSFGAPKAALPEFEVNAAEGGYFASIFKKKQTTPFYPQIKISQIQI